MNPHKGEVEFDAVGQRWRLVYSFNALCALEEQTGRGFAELSKSLADPAKVRLADIRAVLWAGLIDNHPSVTIKQVGDIIGEIKATKAFELFNRALVLAFPEASEDANPPVPGQPTSGTGSAS